MNTENKITELTPRELAEVIVKTLDEKKANNLKLLRIDDKTILSDYFVICGGNSNTQIRALAGEVEKKLEEMGIAPHHIEGYNEATWTVLDYGSVIVHIFSREARDFYKLEKLWSDAEDIDISGLLI
ncbi:MAG: ribosome silencing factor [Ruminococcaceae bacterium]|nr:ribosome silencing factor [Oscillospiraceae bacterium]